MSDPWERIRPGPLDPVTELGLLVIATWLRTARQRAQMTQQHVENLTGIDQTTVSRLENAKLRSLRLKRLALLIGTLEDPGLAMRNAG